MIAICLTAVPAAAVNLNFLRDTPLQRLTASDLAIVELALDNLLDHGAVDDVAQWDNPDTGAAGSVRLLEDYTQGEYSCRRVRFQTRAEETTGNTIHGLCRHPEKGWLFDNL